MSDFKAKDKIKRGPVVEVATRTYSEPIPDDMLPRFEAAGLVVDDNDHSVAIYRAGFKVGAVWGPAVEGDWFGGTTEANIARKPTRDEALACVLDLLAVPSSDVPS